MRRKRLKHLHKVAAGLITGIMLGFYNIAAADGHKIDEHKSDSDKQVKVVNEETSDKVLLTGKDKNAMFNVLRPSVRLVINIEGVDHDIKMSSQMGVTTLYVEDASLKDIESIRKTYVEISNTDNFEIQPISSRESAPYETLDELTIEK
jgi:nitrogen regulatory protein PII-like uncharacterized protein